MIQPHSIFVARRPAVRSGFTLIELLVVIGIIALIIGLLLPTLGRVRRNARNARALADLQAIATALEVYKSDLGDYPPSLSILPPISGGEMLAWTMVGPYNVALGTNIAMDGKDGPGFRVGSRGSVYGPYLDVEKFLLPNPRPTGDSYFLKDTFGQPILYFRRLPRPLSNLPADLYTANDNAAVGLTLNVRPLNRAGAATAQDRFNPVALREKATGPYLLWSAGLDGAFGPQDPSDPKQVKSCDDVLFSGGQ